MYEYFGYGKTTKALAERFGSASFYDDNVKEFFEDESHNKIYPSSAYISNDEKMQVPSPGIKPTNELILKAKNLISEYDVFADVMPFTIWVSGTNGKTTTTSMIEHLLKDKGAISGGNIGTPLGELDPKAPIWVLETSSFTLHYTNRATPNIYALLPITPDHIYWHGSFEEYESAKLKPLLSMGEDDVAIIPSKYRDFPTKAKKITYEKADDLAKEFKLETSKLNFEGAFLLDSLIALGISSLVDSTIDYEKMNSFKIDEHRQEKVIDKKQRLWINDSKATNIDATLVALDNYKDKKIYLILGGDDKGVDMTPLFEYLKALHQNSTPHVELFLIGSNEERLSTLADSYNIKSSTCRTLQNAVTEIDRVHDTNSIAMLSPAAASLDQFSSYIERGDLFKTFVHALS